MVDLLWIIMVNCYSGLYEFSDLRFTEIGECKSK